MFSSTEITSSSVKTVCDVHNRDVCNKGAMCFFCVYGVWFFPRLCFFAQHCAAAASVSCAPVLSLSLSPVSFFSSFLTSSLLLYELLVLFVWHWGRGSGRRIWICSCFFLGGFSPALNRFFSGVIERFVRVLSLSLSLFSLSPVIISVCDIFFAIYCSHYWMVAESISRLHFVDSPEYGKVAEEDLNKISSFASSFCNVYLQF